MQASCAVAVDGRAGRSTWIYHPDRNLWSGALPRDCGGTSGGLMPIGIWVAWRCACRCRPCCLQLLLRTRWMRGDMPSGHFCRVAPIRILPVRRVFRHPVFRMPRYSIGGA